MAEQHLSRNEASAARALTVIASSPASRTRAAAPADAAFIAQLLACRAGMPAYRAHRRAEPAAAACCYRTALALTD